MMEGKLITPVRLNVTSFSPREFWWSHYGFRPQYEDVLQIQSADKKVDYGAKLYTKGYVRETLGKKDTLAKRYREQIQEKFERGIDTLLCEDQIIFSRQYKPTPLVLNEVSPWFLNGETITIPSTPYFSIYHPAEYETFEVVERAVRRFGREYAGIPFSEVLMVNEQFSEQEARRTYEEQEREAEKNRGQKRELRMDVKSLAILVGQDEVERHQDVEYGIFGNDNHLYAELKDGSRHPIGKPRLQVLKDEDG